MSNYIKTVYNEKDRPITSYPDQLAKYLFDKYNMQPGEKLLEPGVGRGDFLKAFQRLGLDVYGQDLSYEAKELNPGIEITLGTAEQLSYEDNTFDIVYSKSLIEHLWYPDSYVKEAYRILKPGGLFLTLTPYWSSGMKQFYDDYTHRTPFTEISLNDIYKMFGFQNVNVVKFRQLPITWKYPILNYFCACITPLIPFRTKNKFLFWSKEIMLIGSGTK